MTYILYLYAKNSNPIKTINKTNKNYRKYFSFLKIVEARHYFRGQFWGRDNFWCQAKILFGANFGAKIDARPTLRPDQANGARHAENLSGLTSYFCLYALFYWSDQNQPFWDYKYKSESSIYHRVEFYPNVFLINF